MICPECKRRQGQDRFSGHCGEKCYARWWARKRCEEYKPTKNFRSAPSLTLREFYCLAMAEFQRRYEPRATRAIMRVAAEMREWREIAGLTGPRVQYAGAQNRRTATMVETVMSRLPVGIDASLTATAVSFGDGGTFVVPPAPAEGKLMHDRYQRYRRYVASIVKSITGSAHGGIVCLEGFSFNSSAAAVPICEFGTHLRQALLDLDENQGRFRVVEVSPSEVKKFATGKGNANKIQVVTAVVKRWGVEFGTDDEYDAYVLARIAMCLMGQARPDNKEQRDIVAAAQERLR